MVAWFIALFIGVYLWIMRGVALDLQRELDDAKRKYADAQRELNDARRHYNEVRRLYEEAKSGRVGFNVSDDCVDTR